VLSGRIAAFAPVSGSYYVASRPCDPSFVAIPCELWRSWDGWKVVAHVKVGTG